jgi:hypothetical protein
MNHDHVPAGPESLIVGTLIDRAVARTKVLDGERTVPVLCLELVSDSPLRLPVHVEQPFPAGHFAQCEAAARRLKKGARVTVQAPVLGWKLIAANATHVHTENDEENP